MSRRSRARSVTMLAMKDVSRLNRLWCGLSNHFFGAELLLKVEPASIEPTTPMIEALQVRRPCASPLETFGMFFLRRA